MLSLCNVSCSAIGGVIRELHASFDNKNRKLYKKIRAKRNCGDLTLSINISCPMPVGVFNNEMGDFAVAFLPRCLLRRLGMRQTDLHP